MTKEEAIHFAECLKHNYTINFADMEVFCDMAIKALEQEPVYFPPCVDCNTKMNEIREAYDKLKNQEPCEDAVSRNQVVEWLQRASDNSIQHAIDSNLEFMPPVTPTRKEWIPVSERLPEENGRYLVTRGLNACGSLWNRVYIVNYSDLMGLESERIWWDGNVGKSDFKWIEDVVAWMPLPEPYEEREGKEE